MFGRRAGKNAALKARKIKAGKLTLEHVKKYHKELKKVGIEEDKKSPMVLPDYKGKV